MNAVDPTPGLPLAAPRLTLVVPTFNRSKILADALRSFSVQDLDTSLFEIVVVDNGSSDDTASVVDRELRHTACVWRYEHESRPGLHHARNRGLLVAKGDIVVFGDDDIIADAKWLSSLLAEFDRSPEVGVVGGRVLPKWEHAPPAWIYDYGSEKAHTVFAYLDRGDEREVLQHAHVIGCNFAIRREIGLQIGGSLPDTFPAHLRHLSGTGESGMIDNARQTGCAVVYAPGAIVHHCTAASRMTLSYFIARYRRSAVEDAFDEFRTYGRWGGALHLTRRTVSRLAWLAFDARGKRNKPYFVAVRVAMSVEAFAQVLRVLFRPRLYRHTRQESYL